MYDSILNVNKRFKASVNLSYDLYNEDKISQYVPTTDLCDVIKEYTKSVLKNGDKATLLAGPYGKGKSYLMLMLTFLFSKRENKELFKKVLNRIKKIDAELYELLIELDSKNISLLPVIINNNSFDDINQNFMIALKNSLIDHKINDLVPVTAYTECLDLIKKWEDNSDSNFDILDLCLRKLNIDLNDLKNGLKNYELESYKIFERLFSCVSHGYSFNPLISNDIGLVYSDVSIKLQNYGYSGMFVIFDEFGAFLDSQTSGFTSKLNKIQSFAEKCESSGINNQMHFCCIIHKDIKLYCDKDNVYRNEFETIAGRFKQRRFDRSLDENYQILCQAIEKKPDYKNAVNVYKEKNAEFLGNLKESGIFNDAKQVEYIIDNGYPFNPIALYALIQSSEKVAQNERTLFTFISDNDVNSFNYFILNNNESLLNVPVIYEYFSNLIRNNAIYKEIAYKVDSLKRMTLVEEERDIIKVIALIKLIDDEVKYSSSVNNISLSLNKKPEVIEGMISSMISRNLLKKNVNDNSIDFAVIADNSINELINNTVLKKFADQQLSDLLNKFDKNKYYISNEYNFNNNMVRFYKSIYLEASKVMNVSDFSNLMVGQDCDGIIINLINDSKAKSSDIIEVISNAKIKNLIIRYVDKPFNNIAKERLYSLFAAKYLMENKKEVSDTVRLVLPSYIEDSTSEVNKYLKSVYDNARVYNSFTLNKNKVSLKDAINKSLSSVFYKTVIFNNEQVNKNNISSVTSKARNVIVDDVLNHRIKDYGTTSQEATMFDSYSESIKNHDEVVKLIINWLASSNGNKLNAFDIVSTLSKTPYGMRKGIMPLYIATAISRISISDNDNFDTVILYNDIQEIELSASNIASLVNNPKKYYFCYTKISSNKLKVTNDLIKLFNCDSSASFSDNIICLVKKIKNKVSNLAPIIIKSDKKDNILGLDEDELKFKDLMLKHDLNNYELLFNTIPNTIGCSYDELVKNLNSIFGGYDMKLNSFYEKSIQKVKSKFVSSDTIKSSFELWYSKHKQIDKIVFELNEKNMYKTLKTIEYNDDDAINLLSYSTLGCKLDNWSTKKMELFFKIIDIMISKTDSYVEDRNVSKEEFKTEKNVPLSSIGKTLYSNLADSLDEYGDSISNEEKAIILRKLLNDILN